MPDRYDSRSTEPDHTTRLADTDQRGVEATAARGTEVGEKNGLLVRAFMLRNFSFLKGYAESVEHKQIARVKRQTREYQAKRIEALSRGREQRIKLLAAARAQAVVIKAGARRQARIIRKGADAKALRLVRAALADYPYMLTYPCWLPFPST